MHDDYRIRSGRKLVVRPAAGDWRGTATRRDTGGPPRMVRPNGDIVRDSMTHQLRNGIAVLALLGMAVPGILQNGTLAAQLTGTNHVLELDGGHVELPPNIFNDLTQAQDEAWVRWMSWAKPSASSTTATRCGT